MASTLTSTRPARGGSTRLQCSSVALASLAAAAIAAASVTTQETSQKEQIVTTQHQITLDGRPLRYTARAGLLPIRDNDTGELRAQIYFVSYSLERAAGQPPRPLAFLWNGGPGMNSSLVHLLGFGPKRVKTGDVYPTSPPLSETELEDNQETWLDQMDMVFVDPVGTGYSRPVRTEYADGFYETPGDAEAVAEFVRVFRVRFDAWDQPLFIAGHSYGTTRAMAMSAILERRGIPLSGVVLMSGSLTIGQPTLTPELSTALAVPAMTAAAYYHKKLAPELQSDLDIALQEAEGWALKVYAPWLGRREALDADEREWLADALSRYTGLPVSAIDRKTLSIERDQFRTQLLPGQHAGHVRLSDLASRRFAGRGPGALSRAPRRSELCARLQVGARHVDSSESLHAPRAPVPERSAVSRTARRGLPVDRVIDQPQIQMDQRKPIDDRRSESAAPAGHASESSHPRLPASRPVRLYWQRMCASPLHHQPSRPGDPPQGDDRVLSRRARLLYRQARTPTGQGRHDDVRAAHPGRRERRWFSRMNDSVRCVRAPARTCREVTGPGEGCRAGKGRLRESGADLGHGFARLLERPRDPLVRAVASRRTGPRVPLVGCR